MNKLSLLFLACLVAGCVTGQGQQISPVTHEVIVRVMADKDEPVKVETGEKIIRTMEVDNPEGNLSNLTFTCNDEAFTKIFSGLSIRDVTNVWNDFCILKAATKIRDVNLFINSPGGDAFAGLALADQIERAKKNGFRVTGHASGIVASAAVPVFAVCDVRLAADGTIFMVHEASLWKWPGRETASDIRSQNDLMKLLRERYIEKLTNNSKLAKEKWEELENKTTWFSAQQAKDWGLVDRIE